MYLKEMGKCMLKICWARQLVLLQGARVWRWGKIMCNLMLAFRVLTKA